MKELLKMAGVLTLISALAGGLLALTNSVTREPIAQSRRAEKLSAMRQVLPEYDNDPMADTCAIQDGGREWIFYVARRQGAFAGAAFEAVSDQGYSGAIRIMAGVGADDTVRGVEITEQLETPGLGARIAEPGLISSRTAALPPPSGPWPRMAAISPPSPALSPSRRGP